ncbi:peptidyl-prolyl cis-trans isomerase cyp5-like [Bidens hawaiensis]|uniref:peptidyl-prolyl cis-trans isomerase cyp5-like n=1 Tax=Bidens hawaiensis TaxID=980011 RepID=UPI00404B0F29
MESGTQLSSSSIPPQDDIEMRNKNNPCVFMDISVNETFAGRLVIELYKDVMPKAAENFRAPCTGESGTGKTTGKPLHYKDSVFYCIQKGIFAEGGDIHNNDAENDIKLRSERGMLYMTRDPQKIDSKFFIVFQYHFFIDRCQYVAVGKVIEGMGALERIEQLATYTGKPTGLVKITDRGEIPQIVESDKVIAFLAKRKNAEKRAISSNESPDGPVKKQRESTPNSHSDS